MVNVCIKQYYFECVASIHMTYFNKNGWTHKIKTAVFMEDPHSTIKRHVSMAFLIKCETICGFFHMGHNVWIDFDYASTHLHVAASC